MFWFVKNKLCNICRTYNQDLSFQFWCQCELFEVQLIFFFHDTSAFLMYFIEHGLQQLSLFCRACLVVFNQSGGLKFLLSSECWSSFGKWRKWGCIGDGKFSANTVTHDYKYTVYNNALFHIYYFNSLIDYSRYFFLIH